MPGDLAPRHRLGHRFDDALRFASEVHRTQARKGGDRIPYIGHLLGVCALVIEDGGSEDEAIAALLHDAAEDQGGAPMLAEIRRTFGDPVADIVAACSDTFDSPKPPWRARKEAYVAHLDGPISPGALRVSLADKLFNARTILRDYRVVGERLWSRFDRRAGRAGQLWYYRALADRFLALVPESPMAAELDVVVSELERRAARP